MANEELTVSVVLPAYNEELVIEDTLRTIKEQDFGRPYEIIVCDNNSTDRTREICEKMGVKVVLEKRKGTRFAYDTAMRSSTGDLILVTNADVRLPKNWVSSIVKEYDDPEIVGVGTKVKFYDCPDWINAYLEFNFAISPKLGMWGVSMSCRRTVFDKVGGLNHGVNTNEDAIFTLLIEKYGKVKIIRDVVVGMDGRRFNKGFLGAVKEWTKGYGLNSLVIQFNYLALGRIKALSKDFVDKRSPVFGKGEEYQLCTIVNVGNDAEYLIPFIYSYQKQDFKRKACLVAFVDGSNDDSIRILKLFPFIKVFNRKAKSWSEDMLNAVLEQNASVYNFVTPDVKLPEDWLETVYKTFDSVKELDLIGGPYLRPYENILSKGLKTPFNIFKVNEHNFACRRETLANALSPDVNTWNGLLEAVKSFARKEKYVSSLSVISIKPDVSMLTKFISTIMQS